MIQYYNIKTNISKNKFESKPFDYIRIGYCYIINLNSINLESI